MTSEQLTALVLDRLSDLKAQDVVRLDVRKLTSIADTLVIASGTSNRHVKALANNVIEGAKEHDVPPIGVEGESAGDWVLVDLGDVIVHVMQPETRAFYNLEKLWAVPA